MSKEEQFEHIENKIKQAIQNNHPDFDEKAWVKMEALLDKDEKNPKPFYWLWILLPVLILGAGGAYFYNYKNSHKSSTENIAKVSTDNTVQSSKKSEILKDTKIAENNPQPLSQKNNEAPIPKNYGLIKKKQIIKDILPPESDQHLKETTDGRQSKINKSKTTATVKGVKENISVNSADIVENSNLYNEKGKVQITDKGKTKIKTSENEPVEDAAIAKKEEDKNVPAEIKKIDTDSSALLIANDKKKPDVDIKNNKKNQPAQVQKKMSPFYLLGSLGADMGSVKLFSFNNSSLAAKYGIGIGYQLNSKWSVQTGFYAGKKKYVAGPNDYHVKKHSYWSYVKITKVDATCMVYEIPVTVRYDFLHKASVSYFATAGVSSYLMKKEDYNYYYIRYNIPQKAYYSYTGNAHFLSTLSLSAGAEKKLSSTLSLQLEPSISLPLSGVGDGKVKLFSTAIMVGVKYLPFEKRK